MQPPDLCSPGDPQGEKPYGCDLYPKRFPHDSTLHTHQRTHTQEKPFCCEHCEKAFDHRANLMVTLWARALHVPRVSHASLGSLKSHQETHSEPLVQDPALGSSPFCSKKEIHNDLSLLNPNPQMGSMDAYEQVQKGPLKLKGVTELGVTKRKKKKDRDKAKLLETMGKIQKNQEEELRRHLDKLTPAQVAFEKGQKALPLETIPDTGELEGQTPSKENLEKDLVKDTGVTRTLSAQEPELLQDHEGDVSTPSGSRRGPLKNHRHVKRKRDSTPTCQDVGQEAALCLDQGEFSGQFGSHSVGAFGTVGPTSLPEGAETPGRAPSECSVCKKSFPYQSQLILHQRTHTGERPFQCDICARGFIQPSDLRVHQRINTGEKPYSCDICFKRFTHNSTLRGHKRTHTQEKPFRCEHCDRAFGHRGNLSVHQCTHSGLKPYVCPECHRAFRQLGTFKRQRKIHSR
ncbi:PREDICTED: zinc finger and SCAN domain-containing protein 5B-like [Bison bison bison]|uniref:Zinc finger and SCAN domain-containing protein 5B-like n=1 Tax=Bison bison bison TaxID=43346 RepID=A0A6P3GHS0_BISBB|nr:PREDICTED: zinc finger and SCAN domain-containing protein 5B-like [Bison bison bison]